MPRGGLAPGGWPATLQLVATAAAIVGASLALVFPAVALVRHQRGGELRFLGLPRWAIALAVGGTAALSTGCMLHALVPLLPMDMRMTAVLLARPVVAGGLALATAGVLCAELLRRSMASVRAAAERGRAHSGRVEVTHPPELRTRTA